MWYIALGILGLLVVVALFTYLSHKIKPIGDNIVTPDEDCCGAHEVCEKAVKQLSQDIIYYDDEELDTYKGTPSNCYNDQAIETFRDVLYTLKQEEIEDWLTSLEKRGIHLPEILYAEAIEMMN